MSGYRGPLSFPAYRRVFTARGISSAGSFMQIVAATWYAFKVTDSAAAVGILAALALGPGVVGAPAGGFLLGHFDLRRLVVTLSVCQAVPPALMSVIELTGELSIGWLYLLVFLGAIPSSLNQPAMALIEPQTVPVEFRQSAVALSSMIYNVTRLFGAVLGGFVVQWVGVAAAFAFNAASFLIVGLTIAALPATYESTRSPAGHTVDLAAGLKRVWAMPLVRNGAIAVAVFFTLVAPVEQLMPVVAKEHGMTPSSVGLLVGAIGVGALLANSLIARFKPGDIRRQQLMAVGLMLAATGLVGLAVTPHHGILIDLLGALLIGLAWESEFVSGQSTVAIEVPPEFRGRLMGIFFLLVTATTAGGAVLLGLLHERMDMAWTFLWTAAVVALSAAVLGVRSGLLPGNRGVSAAGA